MRETKGRIIKNLILINLGGILFGAAIILATMHHEAIEAAFCMLGLPGVILAGIGIADWDEMTDPSATKGGSN